MAYENKYQPPATTKPQSLAAILKTDVIQKSFKNILDKKADIFIGSIIAAVSTNPKLSTCDPHSIINSSMVAATLNLPINQNLGYAYLVPYKNKVQFQMGYKGYIQLAMRTGKYVAMNVAPVYEGDIKSNNRFTGEMEFFEGEPTSDVVIGYYAFFKMANGFKKELYMTVTQITEHGKRYSQTFSYPSGPWKKNYPEMAMKTVLKRLLSKYGELTADMQVAVRADQAAITVEGEYEFVDNPDPEETPVKPKTDKPKSKKAEVKKTVNKKYKTSKEKVSPSSQEEPESDYQGPGEAAETPEEPDGKAKKTRGNAEPGSILPKHKSAVRNLLMAMDMELDDYFKNRKAGFTVADLSEVEGKEASLDLAAMLDDNN